MVLPSELDVAVVLSAAAPVGGVETSPPEARFELPPSGLELGAFAPEVELVPAELEVPPPDGSGVAPDMPPELRGCDSPTWWGRGDGGTGVTLTGRGARDGAVVAACGRATRTTGAATVGCQAGAR